MYWFFQCSVLPAELVSSKHFQLNADFNLENLLVRNATGVAQRSVYAVTSPVRDLVLCNDYKRMRLVSCGVKFFVRQENKHNPTACKWRATNESVSLLQRYVAPELILKGSLSLLKFMMQHLYPPVESFPEDIRHIVDVPGDGSYIVEIVAGQEAGGTYAQSSLH